MLFTFYIFLISAHAAIMIVVHMMRCVEADWLRKLAISTVRLVLQLKNWLIRFYLIECSSFSPAATLILIIIFGFESLLFGIFTIVMFCTQISAIFTDETQIETLKNEEAKWEKKGKWASLKAVFGRDVGIKWLSPFTKPNFKYFNSTFNKLLDV